MPQESLRGQNSARLAKRQEEDRQESPRTKRNKFIRILFPDAFGAGKGWGMALVWLMLGFMGYLSIESCIGPPSNHIFPWEVRMLIGIVVCYASAVGIINKLIVNEVI